MKSSIKEENKKRIAMIGHKQIPSRKGGVEIVVGELAERLARRGYQVDAYNRFDPNIIEPFKSYLGIRIITIKTFQHERLNAFVYSALATLRALFGRYDVIHYHAEGPCMMLWIPRLFGIRVVATIHGLDWQRDKWGGFAAKMLKFGEKTAARKANEVIVLSRNIKEYFMSAYGREAHFIPNGITKPCPEPVDYISSEYGLKKDEYILFLARLTPEKGVHYLIEAYKQLDTDKKLVIAGGYNHLNEYIEGIIKDVSVNENIIMTGFVEDQILEELFSNAYIYVLPSDIEGMAISLLEAMSFGNCCLVSDIPENTEVIGDAAMCFRKGDVGDLKEKLNLLLSEPRMVNNYKLNSSEYILAKYDWEDVVDQTLGLYFLA